ncbi:MAG TPA: glycosyltransferase family 8 protein [Candidatus Methylacidiphilales bacterium]|nr:glycosyltransferase family 8 protein [Candidatus Methylacidiphilales bacterium]
MSDQNPCQPVRIVCAANASFVAQLCVMLVSLLLHHDKKRGIEIRVLSNGIPDDDRRKIEAALGANSPDFDLNCLRWIDVEPGKFQNIYVLGHATVDTYLRLLAPAKLDTDWDRVLYLDSDMVILSGLSELYDTPFDGKAVAAARDIGIGYVSAKDGVFNFSELGIPPQTHYFNAGVLLMNLRRWRSENLADRVFDYMNRHKDSAYYWDQGGMNAILYDSWIEVSPVWNQTRDINFQDLWTKLGYSTEEWKQARDHPKIVHFSAFLKPWVQYKGIRRPGETWYFEYLGKTPYRTGYKGPLAERIFGRRLYFHAWNVTRKFYLFFKNKLMGLIKKSKN